MRKTTNCLFLLFIGILFFVEINAEISVISSEAPIAHNLVDKPDPIALKVPSNIQKSIAKNPQRYLPELVGYFKQKAKNERHLVRLFHDWITNNISYDVKAYMSGNHPSQDYERVLKYKTAICSGYSNLFDKMCEMARLKSDRISGYSRGYGFNLFDREDMNRQKHSWNAVQCDGQWYLLDLTWDAGFIENRKFVKKYTSNYLFPEPYKFVYSHYPDEPMWQLLDRPISKDQFKDLPEMRKNFFTYDIELMTPIKKVNETGSSYSIKVKTREDVDLKANLYDQRGNKIEGACFSQRIESDVWQIDFLLPKAGLWKVRLYGKEANDEMFNSFGQFGLKSKSGTKSRFPTKYKKFEEYDVQLMSPFEDLKRNKTYRFTIYIPQTEKASIVTDGKWTNMKEVSKDLYELEFKIPQSKELFIYVKKNKNDEKQSAVLKWIID